MQTWRQVHVGGCIVILSQLYEKVRICWWSHLSFKLYGRPTLHGFVLYGDEMFEVCQAAQRFHLNLNWLDTKTNSRCTCSCISTLILKLDLAIFTIAIVNVLSRMVALNSIRVHEERLSRKPSTMPKHLILKSICTHVKCKTCKSNALASLKTWLADACDSQTLLEEVARQKDTLFISRPEIVWSTPKYCHAHCFWWV